MKYNSKQILEILIQYTIGWSLSFMLLSIVRGSGTVELGSVQFEFSKAFFMSMFLGILFGSFSGIIQIITEHYLYKKISFKKLLLIKLFYALLLLFLLIILSYFIVTTFFNVEVGILEFFIEPGSFAIYLHILLTDGLMFVIRLVNLMLGRKNLRKLIQGKFYHPREEERIFMFLDLKSSTNLAEKLGHIRYSELIQDCFYDLGIVQENEAEIYQYVGDEAILTWELKEGLRNNNFINAYYNFINQLTDKKDYYLQKYDCLPFFKAGAHGGIVTVTEVGRYKKEIAFHGDTINTAARIQTKCNEFNEGFLISQKLYNQTKESKYRFSELGSIELKGKQEEVLIYSVNNS